MNKTYSLSTPIWPVIIISALMLAACGDLTLNERQKTVKASNDAMCKARDLQAMRPFVTASSQPLLDISKPVVAIAGLFGMNVADRIAIECQSTKLQFIDEIQVSDHRYIVRTKHSDSVNVSETILVLEDGKWKISLLGN